MDLYVNMNVFTIIRLIWSQRELSRGRSMWGASNSPSCKNKKYLLIYKNRIKGTLVHI